MNTIEMFPNEMQKQNDELLANMKERLPEIEKLLADFHSGEEDGIYRFYHQSFKTFNLQYLVRRARDLFSGIAPGNALVNAWFAAICEDALDHEFDSGRTNDNWMVETRPLLEAFWHCKYFLEQMLRYGRELKAAPQMLPSGWAAILCLYNMR
ncbi:MAG: hypothetical protein ACR2LC_10195 [Pyrinomonadaceae bacterium]